MKWVFRLLTLGSLAIAVMFPFFISDKSGNRMMSIPGIKTEDAPTLMQLEKLPEDEVIRQVYKWKDAQGQWHYSDEPPSDQSAVEQISVSNKTNIIQSLKVPEESEEPEAPKQARAKTASQQESLDRLETESPLTLDRLQNVLKDTQAVKELMESRNAALEELSEGGRE